MTERAEGQSQPDSTDTVAVHRVGRVGRITLNRPRAINALSLSMITAVAETLTAWRENPDIEVVVLGGAGEQGFCAGGDIRAVYESAIAGDDAARQLWCAEYRLDAQLARYPKQVLSLLDGITMGGGMGLGCHRPIRVATERSRLAMPEVRIGMAPDVAGTLLLAQTPGRIGEHLALTGNSVDASSAVYCGLVDHIVPSNRMPELVSRIENEDVATVIADIEQEPDEPELAGHRVWIDTCYSGDTVEEILERLDDDSGRASRTAAAQIRQVSPLAAKVTLGAMQRTRRTVPAIEDVLARDYRVMSRFLDTHDLRDGIRAMVVNKHDSPTWSPSSVEAVPEEMVERHFESLGADELQL